MSFLNPQISFTEEEIEETLKNHPINIEEKIKFEEEDKANIPNEYYSQIVQYYEQNNIAINFESIPEENVYKGYKWVQVDNKITISYEGNPTEELNANIEGNKITSTGFISGTLYRAPQEFTVVKNKNSITIELTVNEKWPLIVIGGEDIDPNSVYLLTFSILRTRFYPICKRLLLHNVNCNHFSSISALSNLSLEERNKKSAFYLNTILYLNCKELYPNAYAVICEILIETKDGGSSAILAENILVSNAKLNVPNAFLYLGFLYLSEIEGFHSSNELAFQYFKEAADKFDLPKASDTVGRMMIFAMGTEKNVEAGFRYLVKANLGDGQILDILKRSGITNEQIKALFKDKSTNGAVKEKKSIAKYVVYGVVGVSAALFLGYRFMKRKK